MSKRFTLTKEVEYKNGKVDTWYIVRLVDENGNSQFIDCTNNDDEEEALKVFNNAVSKWVPTSKTIVKEITVD